MIINNQRKISYGKNIYNHEEIKAVSKTLIKTTQMGKNVSIFERANKSTLNSFFS